MDEQIFLSIFCLLCGKLNNPFPLAEESPNWVIVLPDFAPRVENESESRPGTSGLLVGRLTNKFPPVGEVCALVAKRSDLNWNFNLKCAMRHLPWLHLLGLLLHRPPLPPCRYRFCCVQEFAHWTGRRQRSSYLRSSKKEKSNQAKLVVLQLARWIHKHGPDCERELARSDWWQRSVAANTYTNRIDLLSSTKMSREKNRVLLCGAQRGCEFGTALRYHQPFVFLVSCRRRGHTYAWQTLIGTARPGRRSWKPGINENETKSCALHAEGGTWDAE